MIERRDACLFTGLLSAAIMLICLVIRLSDMSESTYEFGWAAIIFGFAGAVFAIVAFADDVFESRKPLLPINSYAKLKRITVKKVRKKWRQGKLTEPVSRRLKNEFLLKADQLGIVRNQSEDDWDFEIQWRVKR